MSDLDMKPYYEHGGIKIFNGDCRDMSVLPSESVNCCVTSPPYWGLRDYKTEPQIWGGDPDCQHEWNEMPMTLTHDNRNFQKGTQEDCLNNPTGNTHIMSKTELKMGFCRKCGAWRGELGLEPTPEEYVEHLATVFREVRRVLRKDGTLWLVIGDSYAGSGRGNNPNGKQGTNRGTGFDCENPGFIPIGLKPKDLVGIPWRVAFALQADGWWLRQDIIWHKPNPMPESVTDRCTKAHEYVFLLAKSQKYYYDNEAIREEATGYDGRRDTLYKGGEKDMTCGAHERWQVDSDGNHVRNRRSVWTVSTQPFKEAHFATFPPKLIEPMILAGCPEGGTVLDPFLGSGTTGLVAQRLGRRAIGFELSLEYCEMAAKRNQQVGLMAQEVMI